MVRREYVQRSVFEVLLPDGDKLWDPALRRIDEVLADETLLDLVADALGRRRPMSRLRGRLGTPAEVVLRMLVLKHLYDWSFDECEREVRGSLVYRVFCRIDCERVPDAKTLIRLAQLLGPGVLKGIVERLVALARERKVIRGFRLRVDTTVVETNIHYPTDSTLLADGVRVLTRTLKRLRHEVSAGGIQVRDRTRSVGRRVFEIAQRSRTATVRSGSAVRERAKARMKQLYQALMALTRAAVRQAETAAQHVAAGSARGIGLAQIHVEALAQALRDTGGLVHRVLAQTRARILKGDTHYPDKLLSLFEPHTEAIRKGKAAKPTEFGKLVKLQEAEGQFITDWEVCATRVADGDLWVPALERHASLFSRPPRLAVADAGFASGENERAATDRGVRRVVLPKRGRLSPARRAHQRQRWFRRALRWRTGCEGRISVVKRRHGLRRCRYRGLAGMERWVGLGVIANNLCVLGRAGPGKR
ncbi:MAG: ISNCY family transposase [Candidatus Rokubacteria bacterium]|nr:ISNCY family transposase [Candidatus Rokubacteria bacterium]